MTDERWEELLQLTAGQRRKKYSFWFKNEVLKISDKLKQVERRKIHDAKVASVQKQKLEGTWELKNTYNLFVRDATINQWYANNLYYSMLNGPHLLLDCAFENKMTEIELSDLGSQFQHSFAANKIHQEPFHLMFCNLKSGSRTALTLEKHLKNYDEYPFTVTDKPYLKLFPKDRLVYLTPNSPNFLQEYDENDVYIVGGIVDKGGEEPLTLAKSKREGIRTAKFPLDQYLR